MKQNRVFCGFAVGYCIVKGNLNLVGFKIQVLGLFLIDFSGTSIGLIIALFLYVSHLGGSLGALYSL